MKRLTMYVTKFMDRFVSKCRFEIPLWPKSFYAMLLSSGDDIVCQESFKGHFYKRRISMNAALWFERL